MSERLLYLGLLFAYVAEGFWDAFVWCEHVRFFKPFGSLFPAVDDRALLSLLVPLLALPQVTHSIIDAFVRRMRKERERDGWQAVVFGRAGSAG